MPMELLRQLEGCRMPVAVREPADIDKLRVLRAAGLVVALFPVSARALEPAGEPGAALVLALTRQGREALAQFEYPCAGLARRPAPHATRFSWRRLSAHGGPNRY